MNANIYVIHEQGAPRHYEGLEEYCRTNGKTVVYREFSPIRQFASGIKNRQHLRIVKAITNLFFLLRLPFFRNRTIVIGIAPYDFNMVLFNYLAKFNAVYLHTSWPHWEPDTVPKTRLLFIGLFRRYVLRAWQEFFEHRCRGVFCVTERSKSGLLRRYNLNGPVTVVYHSINPKIFYASPFRNYNYRTTCRFLFVGRLEEYKGIKLLLTIFGKQRDLVLGVIGDGSLRSQVVADSSIATNIKYLGKISNKELGEIYREFDFLILPSQRWSNGKWEELFGITIIEAMACGVIPISSNHFGPCEIIKNGVNGFLYDASNPKSAVEDLIQKVCELDVEEVLSVRCTAIRDSERYTSDAIAE